MNKTTNWMDCPDCEGYGCVRTKGLPMELWPECERCEGKSQVPADPDEERRWKAA